MLRIEFEQTMAAHEQMNQMHREMKHIITSLQSHNSNLKKEVGRHKKKGKELSGELQKVETVEEFGLLLVYSEICVFAARPGNYRSPRSSASSAAGVFFSCTIARYDY